MLKRTRVLVLLLIFLLISVQAVTGKEIWHYAYPGEHVRWPGPASTPAIDGDYVYSLGRHGILICFRAKNGNVVWRRDLLADNLAEYSGWGFCCSPVIEGDLLLINAGECGAAFDKKTGRTVWASGNGGSGVSSPILFKQNGHDLALFISDKLRAVDIQTGAVKWSQDWYSDADPMPLKNRLLLIGGHRRPETRLLNLDMNDPEIIWQNRTIKYVFQAPVVLGNHIFSFASVRNKQPLVCMDINSSEILWSENLGQFGSLMAAGDKLIIISDGELIIAEASSESFQPISRATLFDLKPMNQYPNGEPNTCWTQPILANGKIYARTTWGNLVCVDVRN